MNQLVGRGMGGQGWVQPPARPPPFYSTPDLCSNVYMTTYPLISFLVISFMFTFSIKFVLILDDPNISQHSSFIPEGSDAMEKNLTVIAFASCRCNDNF